MDRRLIPGWERMVVWKERVLERVLAIPAERRETRPSETSWAMVDVVEHLVLVEGGIRTALAKEPSPEKPRAFRRGRRLRWLVMRGVLHFGVRIQAPTEAILPTRRFPWHALLAHWEDDRRQLEEWLRGADPAIHATPRFRHPIVGWLDVPQALTFAADHIAHHLQQIDRIDRGLRRGPG